MVWINKLAIEVAEIVRICKYFHVEPGGIEDGACEQKCHEWFQGL